MTDRCPPIDEALLKHLEEVFPDRVVDPVVESPEKAFGKQQVVRYLRHQHNAQEAQHEV